ncbi:pentapeptide repeat-containing protein [bacterium]|nr:pentapeptide repeat-containing protein [bacterium]
MGYEYFGDKKKYRPKPLTWWEKLIRFQKMCSWFIYHYSGLHFVVWKIIPLKKSEEKPPPFVFLAIIVVYIAIFGITSYRFETCYNQLEVRLDTLEAQLAATANIDNDKFKSLLETLPAIQNSRCPIEPNLSNPLTVFGSLFLEERNEKILSRTMKIFALWKNRLSGLILIKPIFKDFDFREINFEGTVLEMPGFVNVNMENSRFKNAELYLATFKDANLDKADFRNSLVAYSTLSTDQEEQHNSGKSSREKMEDINLEGARLFFVDFREFPTNYEKIATVSTLYGSVFSVKLCDEIAKKNRSLLNTPDGSPDFEGLKKIDKYSKTFQYAVDNPLAEYLTRISGKSCTYK